MRVLSFLVAFFVAAGCGRAPLRSSGGYATTPHQVMFGSSLRVVASCWDGRRTAGSGVAISPRHALTARHVLFACGGEPPLILAIPRGGRAVEMVIDDAVPGADVVRLVVVGTRSPFRAHARLSTARPRVGDEVCTVASDGASGMPLMKCARVSLVEGSSLVAAVDLVPGNSGAPAFDAAGDVIGIWTNAQQAPGTSPLGVAAMTGSWRRLAVSELPDLM